MSPALSGHLISFVSSAVPIIGIVLMILGARGKPPFVSWQRIAIWICLALPVMELAFFFISGPAGILLYRLPFLPLAIPPVLGAILVFGLLLSSREGQQKWFSGLLLLVCTLAVIVLVFARICTYPD